MLDRYKRHINYLRISVTDRCNLRCVYCMPEEGIHLLRREEILSFEEIAEVVEKGAELGIRKIRLTGGEPLVRRGIVQLVGMIKKIRGIDEITMTTNGIMLPALAQQLKDAGLDRVNISLDAVDSQKFREISGGGNLEDVFSGIRAAVKAGLLPVKINVVKLHENDEQQIASVRKYAAEMGLQMRVIRQMNLVKGEFYRVDGGDGGNCRKCNRLRLTANGMLMPCLFSNEEFSIRKLGIREAFIKALAAKPEQGSVNNRNRFYNIGG
jgi:GTP 3',8-cyclase